MHSYDQWLSILTSTVCLIRPITAVIVRITDVRIGNTATVFALELIRWTGRRRRYTHNQPQFRLSDLHHHQLFTNWYCSETNCAHRWLGDILHCLFCATQMRASLLIDWLISSLSGKWRLLWSKRLVEVVNDCRFLSNTSFTLLLIYWFMIYRM